LVRAGTPNSSGPNSKDRAAWKVIERHCPGKPEGQCREIIKTWVRNGVLLSEPYDDPVRRELVNGVRVNASKRPGA
jgi:hypothetical protein